MTVETDNYAPLQLEQQAAHVQKKEHDIIYNDAWPDFILWQLSYHNTTDISTAYSAHTWTVFSTSTNISTTFTTCVHINKHFTCCNLFLFFWQSVVGWLLKIYAHVKEQLFP